MKKTFSKTICVILAIMMIFSSLPITAFAAISSENSDYQYKKVSTSNDETLIEITSYTGNENEVIVPAALDGYKVVGISDAFFRKGQGLHIHKVTIPEGVKYIDNDTFCGMTISVELPSTLEYIGKTAFMDSKIESINFPENLKGIGRLAFYNAEFTNPDIVLPDSLEYIYYSTDDIEDCSVFEYSNIESVYLSENIRFAKNLTYDFNTGFSFEETDNEIFPNPFYECQNLNKIEVNENNPYLTSINSNILCTKSLEMLLSCTVRDGASLSLPSGIKEIAEYAFNYCLIDELTISETVETLNANIAYFAEINRLSFSENSVLGIIESRTFSECSLSGDLTLPKSVKYIGEEAFAQTDITSLSFETPSKCKTICKNAFSECNSLKDIFIPNSVTKLGGVQGETSNSLEPFTVFEGDNIENITFEDNSQLTYLPYDVFVAYRLKTIDFGKNSLLEIINCTFDVSEKADLSGCTNLYQLRAGTFYGCSFTSIDLSNTKITALPAGCFQNCKNLSEVTLSDTTHYIEEYAFKDCGKLKNIDLSNVGYLGYAVFQGTGVPYYCYTLQSTSVKTDDIFKYYEYGEGVVIFGVVKEKNHVKNDVVIPAEINGKPVIGISDAAFYEYEMTSVSIPDTVEYIDSRAFQNCRLEEVPNLPQSLTFIGDTAFSGNFENGGDLVIPDNVTTISGGAFKNCRLDSVTFGNSVKSIGANAFFGNQNIENISLPDSVQSVGKNAFASNNLKSINFGKNISNIPEIITYHSDIYEIGDDETPQYFETLEEVNVSSENPYYSSLNGILFSKDGTCIICYPMGRPDENYEMPDSVIKVETGCFTANKYLKNISLSDNLETISENSFNNTESLISIVLPKSVTSVEKNAFYGCEALENVEFTDGLSIPELNSTFKECKKLNNVTFGDNVQINRITNYAFSFTAINSIALPDKVYCIDNYAFSNEVHNNNYLTEVILPLYLEKLENGAFRGTNLESIIIPENLENIGYEVFSDCRNLKNIDFGNVKGLAGCAFSKCRSLESIDLTGVIFVSDTAFHQCKNLKKLYFTKEEKNTYIAENEFQGNDTIETVVVGSSINEIQDYAFADCRSLESALISDSVTEISDTAFDNCSELTIVCMAQSYAMAYAIRNEIPYTTFVVDPIPDQTYTGKEITPELNVSAQNRTLALGSDYTAVYTDNIEVGNAKVNVIGLGDFSIFASLVHFNIIKGNYEEKPDDNKTNNTGENEKPSDNRNENSNPNKPADGNSDNNPPNNANSNSDKTASQNSNIQSGTNGGKTNTDKSSANSNSSVRTGNNGEATENQKTDDNNDTQTKDENAKADENNKTEKEIKNEKLNILDRIVYFFLSLIARIIRFIKSLFI